MVANAWLLLAGISVLLCDPPCTPLCAAQHSAARHQARILLVLKGRCWEWMFAWDPLHRACFGALTPTGHASFHLPFSCSVGCCGCDRAWTVPATTEWAEEPEAGGTDGGVSPRESRLLLPQVLGELGMAHREEGEGVATVKGNHALIPSKLLEAGVLADNREYAQYLWVTKRIWPISELNMGKLALSLLALTGPYGWMEDQTVRLSAPMSPNFSLKREMVIFQKMAPALSVTASQVPWHQILIWHRTWAVRVHFITNSISNPLDLMTFAPLLSHQSVTLTQILSQFKGKRTALQRTDYCKSTLKNEQKEGRAEPRHKRSHHKIRRVHKKP